MDTFTSAFGIARVNIVPIHGVIAIVVRVVSQKNLPKPGTLSARYVSTMNLLVVEAMNSTGTGQTSPYRQ
jgi:hypothetical protein